jgi:uncharacterized protein YjbI with pentapeptide repeats
LVQNKKLPEHDAGASSLHQQLESQSAASVAGAPADTSQNSMLSSRAKTILSALQADVTGRIEGSSDPNFCEPPDSNEPPQILAPNRARISRLQQASLQALLSRTAERDFGINLECGQFRGAYLSGAIANASDLSRADFSGSDLYQAFLHDSFVTDTNFDGANLTAADFSQSRILKRVSGASFCYDRNYATYALSQGRSPISAQLGGAQFQSSCGDHISFAGAFLQNAVLSSIQFYDVDFTRAQMRRADLRDSTLVDAHFSEADLREAKLTPSGDPPNFDPNRAIVFFNADFSKADLERADLSKARLHHANFNGANLTDTRMRGTILSHDVSFDDAILLRTDLTGITYDNRDLPLDLAKLLLQNKTVAVCHAKLDSDSDFSSNDGCEKASLKLAEFAGRQRDNSAPVTCWRQGTRKNVYQDIGKACVLRAIVNNCIAVERNSGGTPIVNTPDAKCDLKAVREDFK